MGDRPRQRGQDHEQRQDQPPLNASTAHFTSEHGRLLGAAVAARPLRITAFRTRLPRNPPIDLPRKILCAAALATSALLVVPVGVGATRARQAPLQRLLDARLAQAGRDLILSLRTAQPVSLAKLEALPDTRRAGSRYLCLALSRESGGGERRLCLGGRRAHRVVGLELVNAIGKPLSKTAVRATVKRPDPQKLVVALVPSDAGLLPGRYSWRALQSRGCERRPGCAESLPTDGGRAFRLRPVRAVGCTGGGAGLLSSGPRDRNAVALSFDDGPSDYTPAFLQVLREKDVDATFFQIGQEMPGREATMRQILAEGSEIGDHTENHVEYPGYSQIAGAAARIEDYTHFKPCLFRPPGGAVDSSVIATAGSLGMRTITWDVDPADWQNPGSAAVYSRIVGAAQPGSIILMHDGGGDRSGTLAALPSIIDTLRARGYRFETVSELLGHRLLYRPYG
jgi:peptidoglycan/xylan/chitin deacetylase (PgdA/CDA1 family)